MGSTQTHERRALVTGLLLVIFMLGLALRLYQLDADSMWLDEIHTASRAKQDLFSVVTYDENYTHPPLGDIVTWFFIRLSGDSDFVIRLQAVLFGSLSILLAFKAAEMLWAGKEGMIAAFLLAVNAYHIQYSQEARPYALMVFLALLSLIFLTKALQKNKLRTWLSFVLCTSLSLYNHYCAFLFLPAEAIYAACVVAQNRLPHRSKSDRALKDPSFHCASVPARQALILCLSLALIGASYLPWLPALQSHTVRLSGSPVGTVATTGAFESSLSLLQTVLTDYSAMSGVALLLWVAMFVIGLATSDLLWRVLATSWLGTPFAFFSVVQSEVGSKPRYVLFVLPVCLLVIARGITSGNRWLARTASAMSSRRKVLSVLGPTLIVLVVSGFNVASVRDYYTRQKEDWRGTATYLSENLAPGDGIIADSTLYRTGRDADRVKDSLGYYLDAHGAGGNPLFSVDQMLWRRLAEWEQWNGRLWAVLWHPWEHPKVSTDHAVELTNVSILRLQEPSGDAPLDTERLFQLILRLIPEGDARFDVHLALVNLYLRTGRLEQARTELNLASELAPDDPTVSVSLQRGAARLGRLSQTLSAMPYPLWRSFGGEVALLGYDLQPETPQPGDTLVLTVWWYPVQEMERDYTAFVHLLDRSGSMRAQQDRLLQRRQRPTSQWKPGAVTTEKYEISLPRDAAPGLYAINLGVYYWETAERLPVRDEAGERLPNDVVQVCQIEVEG